MQDKTNCAPNTIFLTHSEAIKRLEKNECPLSLITISAKQGKHALYLQVADEATIICQQMRQFSKQSIDYYRVPNCGNPSYTCRYPGVERLTQNTVEALLNGDVIHIKSDIFSGLKVQATDIEAKYHMERYIKSCIQVDEYGANKSSNVFQMKSTLHLEKDIDAMIFDYHASKLRSTEGVMAPPQESIPDVTTQKEPKQKRSRAKQHPLFKEYAKAYLNAGSFGDYLKTMEEEQYVFNSKGDYLKNVNDDNSDNTHDDIKHVALVRGVSKHGNPKYDIYYKPVQNDGTSLGKFKSIAARTAETYFT